MVSLVSLPKVWYAAQEPSGETMQVPIGSWGRGCAEDPALPGLDLAGRDQHVVAKDRVGNDHGLIDSVLYAAFVDYIVRF